MKSNFILGMCLLFLIQYFVRSEWLQLVLAVCAVIAFAGSVTRARTVPRIFSLLMFVSGIALTALKGLGIEAAAGCYVESAVADFAGTRSAVVNSI